MAALREPRFAKSYAANVVLVVLTLFPGLINTSAIALASPAIGTDLAVTPEAAATLPLISDAALAFGCVLAAELTRRVESRKMYFILLALSLATSLASALAQHFGVLLVAHTFHGLAAGMLFIVVLPPLLTTFGSGKLGATASVLVPALFGASTLGPVVGGLIAAPGTWRLIFAAEVVIALIAFALARHVLTKREPQAAHEPVDWYALGTSFVGSALIYAGVGNLAGHDWRDPFASGPVAAGVLLYIALIVGEAREHTPLVPVRKLATSLALIGTIATVIGSMTFSALTQCFMLTLLRVQELSARATGLAFWPEFPCAVAAGFLFGRLVTTRWVTLTGASGLALTALAATLAAIRTPVTPREVEGLSALGAFGAGLSVSPGLFLVALSFERPMVGRAIALLNLFRLTGGFISAPGVEHTIGSQAIEHLRAINPSAPMLMENAVRALIVGRVVPYALPSPVLRLALALGIGDACVVIVVLALVGIAAIALLLIAAHVPLRAPDPRRFDEGRPALEAPRLA
jgi:MFS family permease